MKKRLLLIALVIMLSTSSAMQSEIHAEAAATSAGLTTYTMGKVFLALLALAGVVVAESDIEFIWDENGLNVDAVINNMMVYSRTLGMGMRNILGSGAAGATTLTMNRTLWNLFKGWARYRFGTVAGVRTQLGTVQSDVSPLSAGRTFTIGYEYNGRIGGMNITFDRDVFVFWSETMQTNSNLTMTHNFIFVPAQQIETSSELTTFYNGMTLDTSNINGVGINAGPYLSPAYSGTKYGYYLLSLGRNSRYSFSSMDAIHADVINLGIGLTEAAMVDSIWNNYMETYYSTGNIAVTDDIEAYPIEGVEGETATQEGQDVISFGNTATQEGSDVVIDGGLSIALPAVNNLEDLLKKLAAGTLTYAEYVRALALEGVTTKNTTAELVDAKQLAITTNPYAGNYTVSLDDLFPFCIPFDLYAIIQCFKADPVAPSADITIPTGYNGQEFTWNTYTISLDAFNPVAAVVRVLEYVAFVIGLMFVTRKLIEG